ncbi:MAG TPA: transcription elongation factor GreA [Bacteroidales bacterium]|jgi:transcription elongation factor GreA|nr:transcription elongation factor GreA [Bacteroidales bacterium]MCZ2417249.1 transcription elongation factor GreA [Burkholderiales bacterium]OQC56482.1 MAG: Transcription elongation factor GreA [Bacteroidetes bacterium ADurb.Bin013]MBP8998735.1 transcription elongation factor GreA [Bacteroidales bacterium]MBV6455356.1 Transcription elongation factor GreA [Bacteroidales bacterium]
MTKIHYITAEGLEKLKEELNVLTTVERVAAARAIAEARDKGDLTENSEYDAAKDAQAMLEMKIAKLQYMIANARIVDESRLNTNVVQIMNKVKIQNLKNKSIMEVTLVGESEANLEQRKLAISSPIGKGLLGKKKGEIAQISTPSGIIEFEILEIAL